jgi:hypothetical protein
MDNIFAPPKQKMSRGERMSSLKSVAIVSMKGTSLALAPTSQK